MRLFGQIGRMFFRQGIENDARFTRAVKIYISIIVIFTVAMAAVIVAAIFLMRSARHH